MHLRAPEYQPIARELWEDFAASFSQQHGGCLATLAEVETDLLETRPLTAYAASILIADAEPVVEVSLSRNDTTSCSVRMGVETHYETDNVVGLYLHCTQEGEHRGVRIDTVENRSVLLEFQEPKVAVEPRIGATGEKSILSTSATKR